MLETLAHYLCLMIAAAILRIDFWCSYPRLGRSEKYAKRTFAASTASFWRISMSWTSSAIWMSSFIICCGTSSCRIKTCSKLPKSDVDRIIWVQYSLPSDLQFCLFAIVKGAQSSNRKKGLWVVRNGMIVTLLLQRLRMWLAFTSSRHSPLSISQEVYSMQWRRLIDTLWQQNSPSRMKRGNEMSLFLYAFINSGSLSKIKNNKLCNLKVG